MATPETTPKAKAPADTAPIDTSTDPKVQHPALGGDSAAEVDKRAADGSDGTSFRKTFVLKGAGFGNPKHPCHTANARGVVSEAIQRGLHPRGSISLIAATESEPDRRGNVNTTLTYSVEVVPAVVDDEAHKTVSPNQIQS